MSFLAIDYGLRKIGLALSEGELAQPLPVLAVKNVVDAQKKIASLIGLHSADVIIFGIPTPDSIGAEKFAADLERQGLTVIKIDESLTTKLSKEKNKGKTTPEDSIAASILLQEYLDNQKGEALAI